VDDEHEPVEEPQEPTRDELVLGCVEEHAAEHVGKRVRPVRLQADHVTVQRSNVQRVNAADIEHIVVGNPVVTFFPFRRKS